MTLLALTGLAARQTGRWDVSIGPSMGALRSVTQYGGSDLRRAPVLGTAFSADGSGVAMYAGWPSDADVICGVRVHGV